MQMCVHVAVDLSNISRCMKHSVPCGLMKQLTASWSCYWLQSEMWFDLSELPPATSLGVLHSQTGWPGQELEQPLPLHRTDLVQGWLVEVSREGTICRAVGRLCCPHPGFHPCFHCTAWFSRMRDSSLWVLEMKVVPLGLEEEQEEMAERTMPWRRTCARCCPQAQSCSPIIPWIPHASPCSYGHLKPLQ